MKGSGSFPPTIKLVVIGDVLSHAFQKIKPDRFALCFFAKLGADSVVTFAGDSLQLSEAGQVRHGFDPEQNFVFGYRILIRERRVDFGSVVHAAFRLGKGQSRKGTPRELTRGVCLSSFKMIIERSRLEVNVTSVPRIAKRELNFS